MNCDGVRGLLSAYIDGELTPGELLRVEQHLRRCHACADEVDALRQTIQLVASLDEVEVPAYFQAQLHERLVAMGPPASRVRQLPVQQAARAKARRWVLPATAAAAAAAVFAIGLASWRQVGQVPEGLQATGYMQSADEVQQVAEVLSNQGDNGGQPVLLDEADRSAGGVQSEDDQAQPAPEEAESPDTSVDALGGNTEPDPEPNTQPRTGPDVVDPNATRAVTSTSDEKPAEEVTESLEPQPSYATVVRVIAEDRTAVVLALKAQFPDLVEQNGTFTIRVAADKREEAAARIKAIPGMEIESWDVHSEDLALEIAQAEAALDEAVQLLERAGRIEDAAERAAKEQQYQEQMMRAQHSLQRLQDLVQHATFEIAIQSPDQ